MVVAVAAATTQGQGRISVVATGRADMAVAGMEVMASRVAMAMDRVDMEAMAVGTEGMEAGTRVVDMAVVVVEVAEGGIRDGEKRREDMRRG